mgnify:CR=1 FL=1
MPSACGRAAGRRWRQPWFKFGRQHRHVGLLEDAFVGARNNFDGDAAPRVVGPAKRRIKRAEKRAEVGAKQNEVTGIRAGMALVGSAGVGTPQLALVFGIGGKIQVIIQFFADRGGSAGPEAGQAFAREAKLAANE